MTELEPTSAPSVLEVSSFRVEPDVNTQNLVAAAKRMSIRERKEFLEALLRTDEKLPSDKVLNLLDPIQPEKVISYHGWVSMLQKFWKQLGKLLDPAVKIATILTFFLTIGWIKPLPNQVIVDPQRGEGITLVIKQEISLDSPDEVGGTGQHNLRQRIQNLLRQEASGEISEEEFHKQYDQLLNATYQDSSSVAEAKKCCKSAPTSNAKISSPAPIVNKVDKRIATAHELESKF